MKTVPEITYRARRFAVGALATILSMLVAVPALRAEQPPAKSDAQARDEKAKADENAHQKEGDAAASAESSGGKYSEEIFVKGTGGTVAKSSSVATRMDVPLQLTPASVSVV